MDARWWPVGFGLAAGVLAGFLPQALGSVVWIVAALAAGWMLPRAPMLAAALFVLPSIVVGIFRLILSDASDALGAFAIGVAVAIVLAAMFTHIGAGIALRRKS